MAYIYLIRGYRRHQKMRTDKSDPNQQDTFKGDEDDSGSDSDDNDKRKKSEYRKPWKESTVAAPTIDSDVKIGKILFLLVYITVEKTRSLNSQTRSILLNWITQIIWSYCKSHLEPLIPFSHVAVYCI